MSFLPPSAGTPTPPLSQGQACLDAVRRHARHAAGGVLHTTTSRERRRARVRNLAPKTCWPLTRQKKCPGRSNSPKMNHEEKLALAREAVEKICQDLNLRLQEATDDHHHPFQQNEHHLQTLVPLHQGGEEGGDLETSFDEWWAHNQCVLLFI